MGEIWRDVVGYESLFAVSSHGRVYSKRTNRVLKQFVHKNGYCHIATKIGGRLGINKTFKVHRLVAEAFLVRPSAQITDIVSESVYKTALVNHIDGDKKNNLATNLEWCTYSQNIRHAVDLGLIDYSKTSGAKSVMSVFDTEADRYNTYIEYLESGLSQREFAKSKGFTHSVITRMRRDYSDHPPEQP